MRASTTKASAKESFGDVVGLIRESMKWRHGELARRLGISGKSLARYVAGQIPPPSRCRDMVRSLTEVELAIHTRMAVSLAVDPAVIPVVIIPTRVEPGRAKELVTMAVFTVADDLDLTPRKARAVVRMFLQTMVEHGLDAATARAALPAERA